MDTGLLTRFVRRGRWMPVAALVVALAAPLVPDAAALPATPAAPEMTAASSAEPPQRRRRARRPRGQQAPTAERIKEIQAALAERGFYQGEPSGKWDAKSQEAMKKFQEANNLRATGKLEALSLQALGLGSEIAGAAPPRPGAEDGAETPGSSPE
jgi:peptidoglycan hydrolase-like protein with peptidoglycan-binding domain